MIEIFSNLFGYNICCKIEVPTLLSISVALLIMYRSFRNQCKMSDAALSSYERTHNGVSQQNTSQYIPIMSLHDTSGVRVETSSKGARTVKTQPYTYPYLKIVLLVLLRDVDATFNISLTEFNLTYSS